MALTTLMRNRITRHITTLYKEEAIKNTVFPVSPSITMEDRLVIWADAAVAQHCTAKQAAWHAIEMLKLERQTISNER